MTSLNPDRYKRHSSGGYSDYGGYDKDDYGYSVKDDYGYGKEVGYAKETGRSYDSYGAHDSYGYSSYGGGGGYGCSCHDCYSCKGGDKTDLLFPLVLAAAAALAGYVFGDRFGTNNGKRSLDGVDQVAQSVLEGIDYFSVVCKVD